MYNFNTPLYNTLKEYYAKGTVPFHMPGHKLGKGLPEEFPRVLAFLDVTEIPGMDNLHHPTGVIKQAQELAAQAFGSDKTFFLVNGSTCGVYAMVSMMCKPGDTLIIARDCHKSVINGMLMAGVKPVYIMPEYDSRFGISTAITAESVEEKLLANPNAAGVLLTRPNYYGICCDVEKIAAVVHSHNKILAVDEAHGSHFRFNNKFPLCAMDAGADICVQSAHKTLPALTQGAYLHVKSERIDMERLEYYLSVYQTSSPSYIIMASLDAARGIMQKEGNVLLSRLVDSIEKSKAAFLKNDAFILIDDNTIAQFRTDPARIVINTENIGITGYESEIELRRTYNLQVEMSDLFNIVCIATIADTPETISYLFECMERLGASHSGHHNHMYGYLKQSIYRHDQQLEYCDIMQSKSEWVGLDKAAGRISKGIIAPYPPGIPVVCPGEVIFPAVLEHICGIIQAGGSIDGLKDKLEINVIA
ncbi:MAG: aminotransferase class I/II-fold pyridoxal phosphate-dependent enzyme [Ruminiclostridium sp.]|nr:aminotransferase class I/II-fold pyridoxal phosphate-dependent enzyme [Ruminiclostridium sp.]